MSQQSDKAPIVIACGGTGGHVYPGIALAQYVQDRRFVFLGSLTRQDARIVPEYGFEFISIDASPNQLWTVLKGIGQAFRILRRLAPSCVVGTGSYHTVPVIVAAKLLRIPVVLLEQNVIPGRVNRLMAFLAETVCVSFQETLAQGFFSLLRSKVSVTGNPVRTHFPEPTPELKAVLNRLDPNVPVVLVFGGSQGAKAINVCVERLYREDKSRKALTWVHITGRDYFSSQYPGQSLVVVPDQLGPPKALILPYCEAMASLYAKASVVLSRSGATSLAEFSMFRKKAILVPYPFAMDNHQVANAKAFCSAGSGRLLMEDLLTPERLIEAIEALITGDVDNTPNVNPVDTVWQKILLAISR